ncbi:MAG: GNAT family N-acetyltransferase [Acidimicrobiia bacterium]
MPEISTRAAEPGDVGSILEVLRTALGETPLLKRTREQWSWKHEINPFGPSIVLVATAGDRIAGVRALMRWQLGGPGGMTVRCVRPVDTATHPDFERRGIFRRLTMESLEVARDQGAQLVFNTPNARSGAGYLSMGWREVAPIGVMARPRIGRAARVPGSGPPSLTEVIPASEPFRPVDTADRPPRGLRTVRTREYQAWRFGGHPTVRYGAVRSGEGAAAVLRAGVRGPRTELVLSDLVGGAGADEVRRAARGNRSRYMAGFFSKGSPERRSAMAAGMLPVPGVKALRLVALPLTDIDIDVFDLGCWDIATSDLELL